MDLVDWSKVLICFGTLRCFFNFCTNGVKCHLSKVTKVGNFGIDPISDQYPDMG